MPKTITAICGWAIPEPWFEEEIKKVFPEAVLHAIYPKNPADPHEAQKLLTDRPSDWYVGYSLGSLWLQAHRAFLSETAHRALLAPILSFPQEKNQAGKIPLAQLDFFIKTVARSEDLESVLRDFLALGGLFIPEPAMRTLPDRNALLNGLEFLKAVSVEAETAQNCISILGESDPFTDPAQAKSLLPQLEVLEGCGHEPGPLLNKLSQIMTQDRQTL